MSITLIHFDNYRNNISRNGAIDDTGAAAPRGALAGLTSGTSNSVAGAGSGQGSAGTVAVGDLSIIVPILAETADAGVLAAGSSLVNKNDGGVSIISSTGCLSQASVVATLSIPGTSASGIRDRGTGLSCSNSLSSSAGAAAATGIVVVAGRSTSASVAGTLGATPPSGGHQSSCDSSATAALFVSVSSSSSTASSISTLTRSNVALSQEQVVLSSISTSPATASPSSSGVVANSAGGPRRPQEVVRIGGGKQATSSRHQRYQKAEHQVHHQQLRRQHQQQQEEQQSAAAAVVAVQRVGVATTSSLVTGTPQGPAVLTTKAKGSPVAVLLASVTSRNWLSESNSSIMPGGFRTPDLGCKATAVMVIIANRNTGPTW